MSFTDSSRQLSFNSGSKPRLVRQSAFHDEEPSSPRLNVRFLPTIPSAPDSSVQLDEEPEDQPEFVNIVEEKSSDTLQIPKSSHEISSPKNKSKPP
jgi:hypothetical protein